MLCSNCRFKMWHSTSMKSKRLSAIRSCCRLPWPGGLEFRRKKNDRIDKIPVFFYLYLYVFPHVNSPFPNSLFFFVFDWERKKMAKKPPFDFADGCCHHIQQHSSIRSRRHESRMTCSCHVDALVKHRETPLLPTVYLISRNLESN